MTRKSKADITLLAITVFWGFSYFLVDLSLQALPVFLLNALRFILAFLIAAIVFYPKLIKTNKITVKYSAILSGILTAAYTTATFGLQYTSLSNAGFLSSLAVLFTPLILWLLFKHKPEKRTLYSVSLSVVGIALLSLNDKFQPAIGDILCIACSITAALHLIATDIAVKKREVNAFQIGVYQLGFTGGYNLILSLFLEEPSLKGLNTVWVYVLILSIFCSGLAFIGQSIAQQYTTASHVGIIYSLEPVFAGLVAWIFAGDILMVRGYIGAALLVISLLLNVWEPKRMKNKSSEMSVTDQGTD